jgi:hypothetical protein
VQTSPLTFYYREKCHLCDAMRKALVAFSKNRRAIDWHEVDIDRDIGLIRLYDTRVPVLCVGETEVCHYFFDESALIATLALA